MAENVPAFVDDDGIGIGDGVTETDSGRAGVCAVVRAGVRACFAGVDDDDAPPPTPLREGVVVGGDSINAAAGDAAGIGDATGIGIGVGGGIGVGSGVGTDRLGCQIVRAKN